MAAGTAPRGENSHLGTEWKALNYKQWERREELGKSGQNYSEEIRCVAASPV